MSTDSPQHSHAPGRLSARTQAHIHAQNSPQHDARATRRLSVLAWPAWLRVLAVLPVVLALWLAVVWANAGVVAW